MPAVASELGAQLRGEVISPDDAGYDEARVGFEEIRVAFGVDAPGADEQQLAQLLEKTERCCVVLQTLRSPPALVTLPRMR